MDFSKFKVLGKLGFLRSAFSEPNGNGSSARLFIGMIVTFTLGWGTALFCQMHGPVTMNDFSEFLNAAGMFIATSCGPLYLVNKGAAVMNDHVGPPDIPADDHPDDHKE